MLEKLNTEMKENLINKKNSPNSNSGEFIDKYKFKIKDKLEFKFGDTNMVFNYSYPDFNSLFKSLFGKPGYVVEPTDGMLNILRNLRKIDDLTLENSYSKYSIKDILPKDWTVLFWTNKNKNFSGCVSFNDKTIILEENPLTAEGILMLGHEIGHYEEYQGISDEEKNYKEASYTRSHIRMGTGNGNQQDKDVLIKEERDAWAQALNHFRHFNKDLNISNNQIEKKIHGDCLQYYEDKFSELLKKQ